MKGGKEGGREGGKDGRTEGRREGRMDKERREGRMDKEWMREMAVNSQNGGGMKTEGERRGQRGLGMEHAVCGKDWVVCGLWDATQCACDAVWRCVTPCGGV